MCLIDKQCLFLDAKSPLKEWVLCARECAINKKNLLILSNEYCGIDWQWRECLDLGFLLLRMNSKFVFGR